MENKPHKNRISLVALCLAAALLLGAGGFILGRSSGRQLFTENKVVTVGQKGDFINLNEALFYLSQFYPAYRSGGVQCEVRILSGTVIREQITVRQMDLQYITITSEDPVVMVNSQDWDENDLDYHDLRGDVAFIGGENGAGLPAIGTLFQLEQSGGRGTVGYFLNRGSRGVILPGCGFDGFYDGCICNNESSLIMREGVARNMVRWGVHGRHNGEILARSADLSNCGLSAYADRAADLDIREASLKGSQKAMDCRNLSRINANGCEIYYSSAVDGYVVYAEAGGEVNCTDTDIQYGQTHVFCVQKGGTIYTAGAKVSGFPEGKETFHQEPNVLTSDGIIYQ